MYVMELYTARMDQMSGGKCVHGSNVLMMEIIGGDVQLILTVLV